MKFQIHIFNWQRLQAKAVHTSQHNTAYNAAQMPGSRAGVNMHKAIPLPARSPPRRLADQPTERFSFFPSSSPAEAEQMTNHSFLPLYFSSSRKNFFCELMKQFILLSTKRTVKNTIDLSIISITLKINKYL